MASKGWFVAMVATTVETANPEAEIQPGLNLLGPIKQKFLQVSDVNYWCTVLVVELDWVVGALVGSPSRLLAQSLFPSAIS